MLKKEIASLRTAVNGLHPDSAAAQNLLHDAGMVQMKKVSAINKALRRDSRDLRGMGGNIPNFKLIEDKQYAMMR